MECGVWNQETCFCLNINSKIFCRLQACVLECEGPIFSSLSYSGKSYGNLTLNIQIANHWDNIKNLSDNNRQPRKQARTPG